MNCDVSGQMVNGDVNGQVGSDGAVGVNVNSDVVGDFWKWLVGCLV